MTLRSINPATGATIDTYEPHSSAQVDSALALATLAFERHRRMSLQDRSALMNTAADVLESGKAMGAELLTAQFGKTLASSVAEVG